MNAAADIRIERVGPEREPLVMLDNFADDPGAWRRMAAEATFAPAPNHYPGVAAPVPPAYWTAQMPAILRAVGRAFRRPRRLEIVDARFAIVTTRAAALSPKQRLPHVDAFGADRIALVHFLGEAPTGGTNFFRHRATGFQTISEERAPAYFAELHNQLGQDLDAAPPGYVDEGSALFERVGHAAGVPNRALLYRSFQLHSGAIGADDPLSPDPLAGRLTVTGFFRVS